MLTIKDVHKEYRTGSLVQRALDGVSISFREREFVAVLGPSGSGKTTLLNVIGGLDRYDSGEMTVGGVPTSRYGGRDWDAYRNHTIGFIFQNYNLIPHQSLLSNVELAMTLSGVKRDERRAQAREALERVGLLEQAMKKPSQLSGGQMQRVAIARALVNRPSILLADEPTGALDSDTGEQVMQLLKEVAKDHLVVMVTHNPDLAARYASRIVRLKDGQITDDTDPYKPDNFSFLPEQECEVTVEEGETRTDNSDIIDNLEQKRERSKETDSAISEESEQKSKQEEEQSEDHAEKRKVANDPQADIRSPKSRRERKPSMSFLTALSLSVSNLFSKKARTILVAFAASIGIVGIALILSLSNGANAYIRQMERDSLSQYPIEIMSSSFSMEETMMTFAAMRQQSAGEASMDEDRILEQQMMGGMLSSANVNDLASLKRWFDSGYSGMEEYTRGIDYSYGVTPQIYRLLADNDENGDIDQQGNSGNKDSGNESDGGETKEASAIAYRQVNPDQTLAAFGLSMDDSLTGAISNYSLNEVFLPLPENDSLYIDDYTLLAGEWPSQDTDLVLVLTGSGGIPDFLLYTMGLKDPDKLDQQIQGVVTGKGSGASLEEGLVFDPQDFIGITFRLLPAYATYVYDQDLGIWLDQSGDEKRMTELLADAQQMRIVGVVKPDEDVSFGMLGIGLEYPAALLERLMKEAGESELVRAQMADPETDVLTDIRFGDSEDGTSAVSSMLAMLEIHPEHLEDAVSIRWEALDHSDSEETRLTTVRLVRILRELSRTGESATLQSLFEAWLPLLKDLIEIDEERLGDVISFSMDEEQMREMYAARADAGSASYEGNLTRFGYADPETPTRVTIYPEDFESKAEVIRLLDAYNAAMEAEGYEDKVISYTDYVGSLMESVTTIIDVITYVLIAFVAVSLVVSSIMIGIITYISVLERRKEIGILRAMGASKRNITEVFNAETFIIGSLAGVFGMALTLLLLIPINRLIQDYAGQEGIRAFLPPGAGGTLVALCIFLTFVGGFIPSRKAARQDPVAALRSE